MSDNVDALLGGEEDVGDYDLREEEEDALLEDDSYEQSRVISSVHEDSFEEAEDVLEISAEDTLNDDEEADFNDSLIDDGPRHKFTNERAELPSSSSSSIAVNTSSVVPKKPQYLKPEKVSADRGRGLHRRSIRGSFRAGMRGRGAHRGYPNTQNRTKKPWPEAWLKKPWINEPPCNYRPQQPIAPQSTAPAIYPWVTGPPEMQYHQVQQGPMQQMPPQVKISKTSVHQRLGYNNNQPINPFVLPPPMMQQLAPMQPPPQQTFEPERVVSTHPIHNMMPQTQIPPPIQYTQPPPPVFNQPPPQFINHNIYTPQSNYNPPPPAYNPPPQQHYIPQYNPDPNMMHPPPQQQQQITFQNNQYGYEPPPQHGNFFESYHEEKNYNNLVPNIKPQQHHPQRSFNRGNFNRANNVGPKKRKERKPQIETKDNKQRKVFENKNLQEVHTVDTTTPHNVGTIVETEDEEAREYRLQIEKQKRMRERVLAQKEERRKQAAQKNKVEEEFKATLNCKEPNLKITVHQNKPNNKPVFVTNPNLRVINANAPLSPASLAEKEQLKSFLSNRKIIAKDDSLLETSVVVVRNLAAGTSEVKLRKICRGVGDIQKFEMSPKERQATIQFNSVASAHAFYKRYQRFMLDLSVIQVSLKALS